MTVRVFSVSAAAMLVAATLAGCAVADPIEASRACRLWENVWGPEEFTELGDPLRSQTQLSLQSMADRWQEAADYSSELSARVRDDDELMAELMQDFADAAAEAVRALRALAEDTESSELMQAAADERGDIRPVAEDIGVACAIGQIGG